MFTRMGVAEVSRRNARAARRYRTAFRPSEETTVANVNVTYEQMRDQATKLNNGRIEIENMLTQLKGQVEALVSGGFVTDTASQAFNSSYQEFSTGVSSAIEGLDGMATYLNKAAEAFQNVDTELANALG